MFKGYKRKRESSSIDIQNEIAQTAYLAPDGAIKKLKTLLDQLKSEQAKSRVKRKYDPDIQTLNEEITILERQRKKLKHNKRKSGTAQTGMTKAHNKEFARFSILNDIITMWRPINEKTAEKLEQDYMGKGLTLKAKSSEFGPLAGDIPVDVRLSKLAFVDNDKIMTYQEANVQLLEKAEHAFNQIQEPIAEDKIEPLNNLQLVTAIPKIDKLGRQIYIFVNSSDEILKIQSSRRSLAAPTAHTTVHAMSHTAVSVKCLTKSFTAQPEQPDFFKPGFIHAMMRRYALG